MPARQIGAQVREWVADELSKLAFTDDVGFEVYPVDGLIVMAGRPPATQMHWRVVVTLHTGLIGAASRITNHKAIEKPDPGEDVVRAITRASLEELRQHRTRLHAPQNGHSGPPGQVQIKGGG